MRIAYPYNEILPTRKAHDAYIWRNCAGLAEQGAEVTLACGRGTPVAAELAAHYATALPASLRVQPLAILRRNFGLPFTWNRVFLAATQRWLARARPDVTLLSVRKQGAFHLARRIAGVRYVYEVHELEWYPTLGEATAGTPAVKHEREMLARADLVTVTTQALREILERPPYALHNRIAVVPLAIAPPAPTPSIAHGVPLHAMYVGQLYAGQGVEDLVAAVARTPAVRLTVVGGSDADVRRLSSTVPPGAADRITFTGFVAPARIPAMAASAHVFVAPFRSERRMPFVAHTKLAEYVALRRPVIAPDLPIVHEHFPGAHGLVTFDPGDVDSLADALRRASRPQAWQAHYAAVQALTFVDWAGRSRAYLELLGAVARM